MRVVSLRIAAVAIVMTTAGFSENAQAQSKVDEDLVACGTFADHALDTTGDAGDTLRAMGASRSVGDDKTFPMALDVQRAGHAAKDRLLTKVARNKLEQAAAQAVVTEKQAEGAAKFDSVMKVGPVTTGFDYIVECLAKVRLATRP